MFTFVAIKCWHNCRFIERMFYQIINFYLHWRLWSRNFRRYNRLKNGRQSCAPKSINFNWNFRAKVDKKIKKLPAPKIPTKRTIHEVNPEVIPEPPRKRIKETDEELVTKFSHFVTKYLRSTVSYQCVMDKTRDPTKFQIVCGVCRKNISVGYKVGTKGFPNFINTNMYCQTWLF